MQLVLDQGFDLSSFFPDDEINSEDPPYLILKYATNYKKPMHENFQYYQWFATQVKDYITYEEVDDGFIRFYKREVDFLNDNMIRTTKEGLQNWIESKRAKNSPPNCAGNNQIIFLIFIYTRLNQKKENKSKISNQTDYSSGWLSIFASIDVAFLVLQIKPVIRIGGAIIGSASFRNIFQNGKP